MKWHRIICQDASAVRSSSAEWSISGAGTSYKKCYPGCRPPRPFHRITAAARELAVFPSWCAMLRI